MEHTILILLLPLLSFLTLGLGGRRMSHRTAGLVGTAVLGVVTVLCYRTAIAYFTAPRGADGTFATLMPYNFRWLPLTERLSIDLGVLLDPISVMMLVVISTVSLMVHIYSFGYMKGERGFQRYYAFLSLFTMSMLGLVVATNIFQMYLFWELVGVSSYLLIGFYYTRPAAIAASKKAFIVTRFADLGFLVGILIYGYYCGTYTFTPEIQTAGELASSVAASMPDGPTAVYASLPPQAVRMLPLALGLMFIGGAGKSAMFPLHIWLPDAMEGPTPVSALIHAATMVVAGVYLVARMFPLFIEYAPQTLHLVAYVGAFTAFYAASVACVQSDIKRVLAFSTISQIGFMMVALGVCTSTDPHAGGLGYMASMFHLFTHAMFKALLFLGAGSIIHAVHSNEMSAMGGLRRYMPVTHWTFLIACLAIAGIPPFSGFFSKDEILAACFRFTPWMGWVMTAIAAMTAFYMFRLYYGIFWGKPGYPVGADCIRPETQSDTHNANHTSDTYSAVHSGGCNPPLQEPGQKKESASSALSASKESVHHTPHESPLPMTFPLVFLALVTVIAGFLPFGHFVSANGEAYDIHLDWTVAGTSIVIALVSIALATYIYKGERQPVADSLQHRFRTLWTAAYHRFYLDEVYQFVTHRIIFGCISRPIAWFDRHVVDGFFDFLAWSADATADEVRGLQSGRVQQYALVFLLGTLALILVLLL